MRRNFKKGLTDFFQICMPSNLEDIVGATSPLITILLHATGSKTIATALAAGQIIMGISCQMASFSSTTRLTWAWARDAGLPSYFGLVDGKHHVPTRAVGLTSMCIPLSRQPCNLQCLKLLLSAFPSSSNCLSRIFPRVLHIPAAYMSFRLLSAWARAAQFGIKSFRWPPRY